MTVAELKPRATIVFAGEKYQVTGEPLLAHRGWSLFDDFAQFFEVPVRRLDDGEADRLKLEPEAEIEVVATGEDEG